MENTRTSTIRAISPNGVYNGYDKHLVTMADDQQFTFFIKIGNPFPKKLNEEITFKITNEEYKNAKIVDGNQKMYNKPYQKSYPQNNQQVGTTSKDELIVRQTVIKASAEFNARNGNIDLLLEHAEIMYNWIYRK